MGLLLKRDLRQKRTVDGIDISHHNVVHDWNKVKVGFIYAKATEGKSHRDTKFVRFRHNAWLLSATVPLSVSPIFEVDGHTESQ